MIDANATLLLDSMNVFRRIAEAIAASGKKRPGQHFLNSCERSIARLESKFHMTSNRIAYFEGTSPLFPSWRKGLYPAYKANHQPPPQFLTDNMVHLKRMLRNRGFQIEEQEGVEADDLISQKAEALVAEKKWAVIVSTDKDFLKHVGEYVTIWDHFDEINRDKEWVEAKYGVLPSQIPDYLALVGDLSDNIPGATNIGPVKAAALLKAHGDLSSALFAAACDEIPGKMGATLRAETDTLLMYLKLIA